MKREDTRSILESAVAGLSPAQALALAECADLEALTQAAAGIRDRGHGNVVTYSRKVFVPLTKLCRDVCHYCTFAQPPRRGEAVYLTPQQVLEIAVAGGDAGCKEALFTLGDKPELRYPAARRASADAAWRATWRPRAAPGSRSRSWSCRAWDSTSTRPKTCRRLADGRARRAPRRSCATCRSRSRPQA